MSSKLRNCLPMFDATCLLYGGLNHVMFLFLLFFCLLFWLLLSVGVLVCTPICSYIHFFEGVLVRWNCLLELTSRIFVYKIL